MSVPAFRSSERSRDRSPPAQAALFGGLALILLSIAPPLNYGVDGTSVLAVAESLVADGDLTVRCGAGGALEHDAACYSVFYLLQSIVLVPFVAFGRLLGEIGGISPVYGGRAFALVLPALCTAGAATLTYAIAAGPRPRPQRLGLTSAPWHRKRPRRARSFSAPGICMTTSPPAP